MKRFSHHVDLFLCVKEKKNWEKKQHYGCHYSRFVCLRCIAICVAIRQQQSSFILCHTRGELHLLQEIELSLKLKYIWFRIQLKYHWFRRISTTRIRESEFGRCQTSIGVLTIVELPLEFGQLSHFHWNLDNCRTSIGSSTTLSNFHNWRKSYGISTTIYFAGLFIVDFPEEFWQHVLFMSVFLPNFRCRISTTSILNTRNDV